MAGLCILLLLIQPEPGVVAADQWRLPYTLAQAKHGYEAGTAHVAWLREHAPWDCDWLAEANWRRRCWDLLDDCRRIHPRDDDACRRKLAELRGLIGAEWYWRGIMPEPLPSHRFVDR